MSAMGFYPRPEMFSTTVGANELLRSIRRTNDEPLATDLCVQLRLPCLRRGGLTAEAPLPCLPVVTATGQRYLNSLRREIETMGRLFTRDRQLRQLQIKGAGATALRPRQIGRLLSAMVGSFTLADHCDIGLEVEPLRYQPRDARAWRLLGINRIELNVDVAAPNGLNLRHADRLRAMASAVVREARQAGLDKIELQLRLPSSADQEPGLPLASDLIQSLHPGRVVIRNCSATQPPDATRFCHTPTRCPPAQVASADGASLEAWLVRAGYVPLGLGEWVRPGDELIHAQRAGLLQRHYDRFTPSPECDCLGIGVGAVSQIGHALFQNMASEANYLSRIEAGEMAVWRGIELNYEERARSQLIRDILCSCRIDETSMTNDWGLGLRQHFAKEMERLCQLDPGGRLICESGDGLRLTSQGEKTREMIAACFARATEAAPAAPRQAPLKHCGSG